MKKIVIIGLGKHSLSQIKLLREYRTDIEISCLVDNSIASYYRCINHFNNELNSFFSTSISDALSCDPDLIYISTLADSHVEIANQIIDMGYEKKIIIEKPVSNNLIKAKNLKNKIQELNWKGNIYIGFYRRFNSLFQRIKDITLEKKIGALKSIDYFNSVELSMNGSHWIDFANWLIDDDLQDISSILYWNQEPGRRGSRIIDPICNLKMKYKNNINFNIHKTESIDKEKLIELNFENGKIIVDYSEEKATITSSNKNEEINLPFSKDKSFINFLDSINKNESDIPDLDSGISVLEVVIAAHYSDKNKEILKFPLNKDQENIVLSVG